MKCVLFSTYYTTVLTQPHSDATTRRRLMLLTRPQAEVMMNRSVTRMPRPMTMVTGEILYRRRSKVL